jgi:meromycolic acid enoyl-[acyl-carrier protein] reductase
MPAMLAGKRVLVTGVTTHRSIAFAIAHEAQDAGAEVALTTFGPRRPMTERAARRLSELPPVLELDVREERDVTVLVDDLERRWGQLDGAVHSIAFGPPEAMAGDFLSTSTEAAVETFETSVAHELGPLGIRVNLVSAGPLDTPAALASGSYSVAADRWPHQAPLGWDVNDPSGVAQAVVSSSPTGRDIYLGRSSTSTAGTMQSRAQGLG